MISYRYSSSRPESTSRLGPQQPFSLLTVYGRMHTPLGMGLRLRQAREKAGLSLRALADRAGVDFSTIYRIEAGDTVPKLDTLEKLAKALGVSVRDLIEK